MNYTYAFIKDLQDQDLTYLEAWELIGYKKFFVPKDYNELRKDKTIQVRRNIIKTIIRDWFAAFNVLYMLNYTLLLNQIETLSEWLSNPTHETSDQYSIKQFEWLEINEKLEKLIEQYNIKPPFDQNKYNLPRGLFKLFNI